MSASDVLPFKSLQLACVCEAIKKKKKIRWKDLSIILARAYVHRRPALHLFAARLKFVYRDAAKNLNIEAKSIYFNSLFEKVKLVCDISSPYKDC